MSAGNDKSGEHGGLVVVVGVVVGHAHLHGEDMGGVVAAGGVLGVDEQGTRGVIIVADVAQEHRLVLHVVLVLDGYALVHRCLVALETSVHGNARRQHEACLRSGIAVALRGGVVALNPYLVARLRLAEGRGQGDGAIPRRTVVCGSGFCRDMINRALCHDVCRGTKQECCNYMEKLHHL